MVISLTFSLKDVWNFVIDSSLIPIARKYKVVLMDNFKIRNFFCFFSILRYSTDANATGERYVRVFPISTGTDYSILQITKN